MDIDIAGGADITVTEPLLDFLQAHAIGIEQTGAGRGNGYASSGVRPENLGNAGSESRAESAFPSGLHKKHSLERGHSKNANRRALSVIAQAAVWNNSLVSSIIFSKF